MANRLLTIPEKPQHYRKSCSAALRLSCFHPIFPAFHPISGKHFAEMTIIAESFYP
ncbi:hypothetical protein [Chitinophaga sp. GbtcB8]|uniref:hypothetical protein n=1 Tax=Chitinophaga sp. GbtcB8 TaxID=2824753 RepID=UPI001C301408|nr:hypothetical protein [Chitinophaga sp. GbtcB8]